VDRSGRSHGRRGLLLRMRIGSAGRAVRSPPALLFRALPATAAEARQTDGLNRSARRIDRALCKTIRHRRTALDGGGDQSVGGQSSNIIVLQFRRRSSMAVPFGDARVARRMAAVEPGSMLRRPNRADCRTFEYAWPRTETASRSYIRSRPETALTSFPARARCARCRLRSPDLGATSRIHRCVDGSAYVAVCSAETALHRRHSRRSERQS